MGLIPWRSFQVKKTGIALKNHHKWSYPVYVWDEILKGNISGLPKWETHSRAGIYLIHPKFCSGSVALVINPETGHVSPQLHVVFNDKFYRVPFTGEGTIPPNWT